MGGQVKLTDADKTRLLAEGVMGWKAKPKRSQYASWFDGKVAKYPVSCCDYWDPLHNEAHAAEVRERMRELGWHYEICSNSPGYVYVEFFTLSSRREYFVSGQTVPTTICHAALLALGLAKEEEL